MATVLLWRIGKGEGKGCSGRGSFKVTPQPHTQPSVISRARRSRCSAKKKNGKDYNEQLGWDTTFTEWICPNESDSKHY